MSFALSSPLWAAQPAAVAAVPTPAAATTAGAADGCRADLITFDGQMERDGYWRSGGGYGFSFPMSGSGFELFGESAYQGRPGSSSIQYEGVRSGYDVRVLIDSANIMARHGQQQDCKKILAETRILYTAFLTDMRRGGKPIADGTAWRMSEIHAAQPVSSMNVPLRSDQLVGVEVRSPNDAALGSVDDVVINPKTKKVDYVVIARGGIFGFDESQIPVPWMHFKTTPTATLLVLDTTKAILDRAPEVQKGGFSDDADVRIEGPKVDTYWYAHPTTKASD